MAKTPKKETNTRLLSKPTGGTRNSRKEKKDLDELLDGIESNGEGETELDRGPTTIKSEHRKRQAQKAPTSFSFNKQKNKIYAAARKNSTEISRSGTTYIEDAIARFQDLKARELSYEKSLKDMTQLCTFQQASINSLLSVYPALLDDLATRRSDQVNVASEMLQCHPARRQAALKKFSRQARAHLEEVKENEKVASDASAMIKQFKNLLYT